MMRQLFRFATIFALLPILIACSSASENEPVPMKFHSMQRLSNDNSVAVILIQDDGDGYLPIFVDENQALSIYLGQNSIEGHRPLTHDLLASVLSELEARVERIIINDLRDNVYYSKIDLRSGKKSITIDARPSDAIALALRLNAPIFAMNHLLDHLATTPEGDNLLSQVRVRSWGFTVQPIVGKLSRIFEGYTGVLVTRVDRETPAASGGMLVGDLILSVNGHEVRNLDTFSAVMADEGKDRSLELRVLRNEQIENLKLIKSI